VDFRSPTARSIRWAAWEGCEEGLEHLDTRPEGGGLIASGIVAGKTGDKAWGLTYRLVIDEAWRTRDCKLETMSGRSLHLRSDGAGAWWVNGHARRDLHDCIDIDIQATPLTNTLPIRRLPLREGEGATIRVAYVRVPSLAAEEGLQHYTALEPGSLYHFESLDNHFTADLPMDQEGFVLDYPGLFKRLP
jgi:hypothetical protein